MSSSDKRDLSPGRAEANEPKVDPRTALWTHTLEDGIKVDEPSHTRESHGYRCELPIQAPEVSGSYIRRLSTLVPDGYVSRPANFKGREVDPIADTQQNSYGVNVRRVSRYPLHRQIGHYDGKLVETNVTALPMTPPWILHRAKASGFSFVRPSKPVIKGHYVEHLRIRIPKTVGKAVFRGSFLTLKSIGHYLDYVHLGDEAEKMIILSALVGVLDHEVMSGLDSIWGYYKTVFESPNLKVDGSCICVTDIITRNSTGDVADDPILKFSNLAEYFPQDLHVSYDVIDGEPHVVIALTY